jgi:hypothetical protein
LSPNTRIATRLSGDAVRFGISTDAFLEHSEVSLVFALARGLLRLKPSDDRADHATADPDCLWLLAHLRRGGLAIVSHHQTGDIFFTSLLL